MERRGTGKQAPRRALTGYGWLLAVALAVAVAGCGSSTPSTAGTPGLSISGPGLQTSQPPWHPEYAHLAERLKQIAIPQGGVEKFHIHALLHIYVNGLLSPVPAEVGLDPAKGILSSMHTHDKSGVIHMEAAKPFPYTLGDFFAVWGVKLGPAQVGGLTGLGGDHLHFYVNGRTLADPAAYHLRNHDNIVIGYGPASRFPHTPSTYPLYEVDHGLLGCSKAKNGKKAKSCMPSIPAKPKG
jgi:hypothetical protein